MFEANGRRHLLHGDCKEFSWDDGTIQTVQSIEKILCSNELELGLFAETIQGSFPEVPI